MDSSRRPKDLSFKLSPSSKVTISEDLSSALNSVIKYSDTIKKDIKDFNIMALPSQKKDVRSSQKQAI